MRAVYRIYNQTNGKNYIGSSKEVEARIFNHQSDLKKNTHYIKDLQQDYNNGDNFRFEIIKEVSSIKNLHIHEIYYIGKFNCLDFGYNSTYIVSLKDTIVSCKRENLTKAINKLDISREEFCKEVGITERAINEFENGTRLPQVKEANYIYNFFNNRNPSRNLSFFKLFHMEVCKIKE